MDAREDTAYVKSLGSHVKITPRYNDKEVADSYETGRIARQLMSTLEGQAKTEDALEGILYRLRGSTIPGVSAASSSQPDPDHITFLVEATTSRSNRIAELVSEIVNYI